MAAAPGNLIEMQVLRPHCRPTESEMLGAGPSGLSLNSAQNTLGDSDALSRLEIMAAHNRWNPVQKGPSGSSVEGRSRLLAGQPAGPDTFTELLRHLVSSPFLPTVF